MKNKKHEKRAIKAAIKDAQKDVQGREYAEYLTSMNITGYYNHDGQIVKIK